MLLTTVNTTGIRYAQEFDAGTIPIYGNGGGEKGTLGTFVACIEPLVVAGAQLLGGK